MNRNSLRGKTALITGASSGIGRATAFLLARQGAQLALAARNAETLHSVAAEAEKLGVQVLACPTDVSSEKQVNALVSAAVDRFGNIDIAVCNAGQYVRHPAATLSQDDIRRVMEVNFFGTWYVIHAVIPSMLKRRSGHIVAVSSVDGKKGLTLDAAYVASKFALTGYMDVLRQELRGTGVHASTILPGRVDTPMIDNLQVPLVSRKISSDRVAAAVLRAVMGNRGEIIVPYLSGKTLIVANALSPAFADWLVRFLNLEGREMNSNAHKSQTV